MSLDPDTLLVICVANLLALAVLLPIIMGQTLSPAARAARLSLIVHAAAWIAVILSEHAPFPWLDRLLSGISMGCYSLSNWLIFRALGAWLGPRRMARTLAVAAIVMPIGYLVGFDNYSWRVGWANFWLTVQLLILASATLFPKTSLRGRWRHALLLCFGTMAVLTLGRAILGAFFPEAYPRFAAPHPVNLAALLVANLTMVLSNVSLLVAWREEAEQKLRELAITDPLTKLLNRRGWEEKATQAIALAARYGQPLTLLSLDLDHFKRINDEYGHETGDACLRLFSHLLREETRIGDIAARFGGEEFSVLLPMTSPAAAEQFDRRLRSKLQTLSLAEFGFRLNFSTGLACLENTNDRLDDLLRRADNALYQAKNNGRGQLAFGS